MFGEKTLTDVVKGIRASKRDTGLYISSCIAEIKTELKSSDLSIKCNALQKLTFLQMMGYNMSYASFACIEVMSSPRFAHKRIGYLAGCQGCFNASNTHGENDNDNNNNNNNNSNNTINDNSGILLLTTNLLKKELRNASTFGYNGCYEAGLAINFLSNVVTEDLARELLPEVTALTQHPSHAYLRKKAVLCLFKIFIKYPQALRLAFDKVQACLSDNDPAVVSCAVNVITELSTHNNPKNYLLMAPQFFQLVLTSSNNWMLIKVVKLLGSLVSEEPRLARKLLEPLANIVRSTQAKSLLFEAVYTITLALPYCRRNGTMPPNTAEILDLCSSHLKGFVQESDQNLKYLGLVGFGSLMVAISPSTITKEQKDLILSCLSDQDVTLRSRALDLLAIPNAANFATRKNVVELVTQLLKHVDAAGEGDPYQIELVDKIISICKSDRYALLASPENFAWYLSDVLLKLSYINSLEVAHGQLISNQILEIALRVLPIRQLAVKKMVHVLLSEVDLRSSQRQHATTTTTTHDVRSNNKNKNKGIMKSVLVAAAWIVGEYSHLLVDLMMNDEGEQYSSGTYYHSIMKALLLPEYSCCDNLATSTQAIYVQSAMKVFASACCGLLDNKATTSTKDLQQCISILRQSLPFFIESTDADVQERSLSFFKLLQEMGLLTDYNNTNETTQPVVQSTNLLIETKSSNETGDDDDDDDDASEEVDYSTSTNNKNHDVIAALSVTGNLLDLEMGEQHNEQQQQQQQSSLDFSFFDNQASQVAIQQQQQQSAPLNDAEPMKPISAKAQRRLEPPPGFVLDELLDLSIFDSLLTSDNAAGIALLSCINTKTAVSIEDVSFTRQTAKLASQYNNNSHEDHNGSSATGVSSSSLDFFTDGTLKQQHQNYNESRSNANTPFYLPSSSSRSILAAASAVIDTNMAGINMSATTEPHQLSNKFGTIQLDDDDDSSNHDNELGKSSKNKTCKKKKKRKESKTKSSKQAAEQSKMCEADLAMFLSPGNGTTSIPTSNTNNNSNNNNNTAPSQYAVVYRSEDEEEEEQHSSRIKNAANMYNDNIIKNNKAIRSKKTKTTKEFNSLAQVDLTTPLGEEEVMPVRTHRQVPDRAVVEAARKRQVTSTSTKSKNKNGKKSSTDKKMKKKNVEASCTSGDLLDFGLFDSSTNNNNNNNNANMGTQNAFDMLSNELLQPTTNAKETSEVLFSFKSGNNQYNQLPGFSTTITTDAVVHAPKSGPSSGRSKRPWLHATVKAADEALSMCYKVYVSSKERSPPTATIILRLSNNGNVPLREVSLSFIANFQEVKMGDSIAPKERIDSPLKIGPFTYENDAGEYLSKEIKGHIMFSDDGTTNKVPFKVVLPCCLLFVKPKPISSLSHDRIMEELSIGVWSSQSIKLDAKMIASSTTNDDAIHMISSFLKAEVIGDALSSSNAATLAAVSTKGTQVRALIKVTDKHIKIDLKCSNGNYGLSKALSSDLRRLLLL